ncbi:MAG: hypothetical protein K5868_06415 [Lachnospiraceae bacterium]|nr:hypothetical protein [Lachnospiraceae bacterium]
MKEQKRNITDNYPITYDMKSLRLVLGCGRYTAEKIAEEAGARIKIGSRVLYDANKIRAYIAGISE